VETIGLGLAQRATAYLGDVSTQKRVTQKEQKTAKKTQKKDKDYFCVFLDVFCFFCVPEFKTVAILNRHQLPNPFSFHLTPRPAGDDFAALHHEVIIG
jgi:hypothetical protein